MNSLLAIHFLRENGLKIRKFSRPYWSEKDAWINEKVPQKGLIEAVEAQIFFDWISRPIKKACGENRHRSDQRKGIEAARKYRKRAEFKPVEARIFLIG